MSIQIVTNTQAVRILAQPDGTDVVIFRELMGGPGPKGDKGDKGDPGTPGADSTVPGPAGPAGADGQDVTYRGDWIDGTPYVLQDVVRFVTASGLQTFINTSPVTSSTPPDADPTHWEVMTESGAPGAAGATGPAGPSYIPDGTNPATPGLPVQSYPATGIYSPAPNQVGIATAGVSRFVVTEAGNVGIGVSSPTALQIDRVGGDARLLMRGDTAARIQVRRYSADTSGAGFEFAKGRGSIAANGSVVNSDQLGFLDFYGYAGAGLVNAGRIDVSVDGTPGANDMPGRLSFWTTADGAAAPTERLRIANNGHVGIGAAAVPPSRLTVTGGDVEVATIATGLILKSPDGTRYRVTVANGGTLTVTAV